MLLELFISSSLNLIFKKNNKWKRIHDLLYELCSINHYIAKNLKTLEYFTFDDVIDDLLN